MKLFIGLVYALVGSSAAHADEAPPVRAMLADPAQLAAWLRDRDPVLESARAKVEAALELGEQTRVLPNPQLQGAAGGFVIGSTNYGSGGTGSTNPHLSLSQTTNFQIGVAELVELGKRGPRQNAADMRAREAGEASVGALGGRVGDATTALGHLAYAVAKRDLASVNVDFAHKLDVVEKTRLDKADLSPLEYARIEIDREEVERQLGRAEA